jgi:hypothetical protein
MSKHLKFSILGAPLFVAAMCIGGLVALDQLPHASADVVVDAGPAPTRLPDMTIIAPPDIDPVAAAGQAFAEIKAGRYFAAVCVLVILLVYLARRFGPSWVRGDRSGAYLALLVGQATAFMGVAASGKLSAGVILDTIIAGLVLTMAGVGTRQLTKRVVNPQDARAGG